MHRSEQCAQLDFIDSNGIPIGIPIPGINKVASGVRRRITDPVPSSNATCEVSIEADIGALWVFLKSDAPAKFTTGALHDLRAAQDQIAARFRAESSRSGDRLRYQILASRVPDVFSLGGDLALFRDCIRHQNAHTLRAYARDAVDLVFVNATGYELPVTTISLVQGQALGGGFEAALAAHVLVAEKGCKMGLPEIMFNMFPGMGAFQLLSRRLSPAEAERMILSGRTYDAEELHALGVVDVLAEKGEGEDAVRRFIRSHDRQMHGRLGFRRAREAAAPIDRQELYRIADVWVETALGLADRDLATIDYLLRAQERMTARAALAHIPAEMLKEA
jgi:DSF synthase